jgi:hypothetical protein
MSRNDKVVAQASLISDLQSVVGAANAHQPEEPRTPRPYDPAYMTDGNAASHRIPGKYEEVAAVMRYANKTGLGVIPFGRGQYKGEGNLPRRYDIALSVARLNRIIEYEPADLTVTCQAGITLGDISQPLRESTHDSFRLGRPRRRPEHWKLLATNGFGNLQYRSHVTSLSGFSGNAGWANHPRRRQGS